MTNHTESLRFIESLTRCSSSEVTFQTFSETGNSVPNLARVLHGSFSAHVDRLIDLNQRAAGIFVMVNSGDLRGRREANVVAVRAAFVDLDGAPLELLGDSPVKPHIIVESSANRYHAYWVLEGCPLEAFKPLQKALATRFHGDPRVCDLPRVMRLPGFYHRKADPFLTHVISNDASERIAFDHFVERMGLVIQKRDRTLQNDFSGLPLSSVPRGEGDRNRALFDFARSLKAADPDMPYEIRRRLVREWFDENLATIGTKELAVCLSDFERGWKNVKAPKGLILKSVLATLETPPESIEQLGYGSIGQRLCAVMFSLCKHQRRHFQNDLIMLSCRMAGQILGIDKGEANKLLQALARDRVIELVERGAGVRASRWRWIWAGD
jgi:hypothetical protein